MENIENPQLNNTHQNAPEEWKRFFTEFREIRRDVLKSIFDLDDKDLQNKYLDKITEKEKESFSCVDNPEEYLSYHISLAGSVGPASAPNLDFDGEHSLMDFYKKLREEIRAES